PEADLVRTEAILDGVCRRLSAAGVVSDRDIAKVSLIGAGMRSDPGGAAEAARTGAGRKSDPGVAADMFEALADAGVNIEIISTSSIRISCVVRQDLVERAVAAVHERFDLGRDVSQSG